MNIIKKIKRLLRNIEIYNWVRYRTWNRYHVLKMRYLKTGWHDEDELLIHSMFEVLSQFVEGEYEYHIVDWTSDSLQKYVWEEMNSLHKWWINRQYRDKFNPIFQQDIHAPELKPSKSLGEKRINPLTKKEELFTEMKFVHKSKRNEKRWDKACREATLFEEACSKEDESAMVRLIKIRKYLWT